MYYENNLRAARSGLKPFPSVNFSNKQGLITALNAIGFPCSKGIEALAAAGEPLGSGGAKLDLYALDAELKNYNVDATRRLQFKAALSREGLI